MFTNLRRIPYTKALTELARELRKNPTPAEEFFWCNILSKEDYRKFRWLRQRPIGEFIVDFYCAALKLVVEIDGQCHDEQQEYDEVRTEVLEGYGLRVIRFSNDEVLNDPEAVHLRLIKALPPESPLIEGGRKQYAALSAK